MLIMVVEGCCCSSIGSRLTVTRVFDFFPLVVVVAVAVVAVAAASFGIGGGGGGGAWSGFCSEFEFVEWGRRNDEVKRVVLDLK